MRVLDFDEGEHPLCLACVRPYDQGMKAGLAAARHDLDQAQQERARLGDQTRDYLEQLHRAREQLETLRAENRRLREDLEHNLAKWRHEEAAGSARGSADRQERQGSEAPPERSDRPEKRGQAAR